MYATGKEKLFAFERKRESNSTPECLCRLLIEFGKEGSSGKLGEGRDIYTELKLILNFNLVH